MFFFFTGKPLEIMVFQILGTMVIDGLDHGKRAILSLFRLLKFSNSSSVQLFGHIESILSIS